MSVNELDTVKFHREKMLLQPQQEDLPTLEDADEHKLPALNKLLLQMHKLYAELHAKGIQPQVDKDDQYPKNNLYSLLDTEFQHWPLFKIHLKSNWFDPRHPIALHGGFSFHLYLVQDGHEGRHEIADWINISIRHMNTSPIAFASRMEHIRTLGSFLRNQTDSYFFDIPMPFGTHVDFRNISNGMSFRTANFNLAVDNACIVMQKIIRRKDFLVVVAD